MAFPVSTLISIGTPPTSGNPCSRSGRESAPCWSSRTSRQRKSNFGLILAELAKRLRRANQKEQDRRLNNRLNRTIAGFLADYPTPTTRERGRLLVEEVQASAENSDEGDRVRLLVEKLRRDFDLDEDLTEPIERYDEFRERVEALRYENRLAKQDPKVVVGEAVAEVTAASAVAPSDGASLAAASADGTAQAAVTKTD